MIGVMVDEDGDAFLNEDGTLGVVNDDDHFNDVQMVVQSSLRTFYGEVFTDRDVGCNWLDIFQIKAPQRELRNLMENEVKAHAFDANPSLRTNELEIVSILFNGEKRKMDIVLRYDGREIVV
jgi:hypothetical protein